VFKVDHLTRINLKEQCLLRCDKHHTKNGGMTELGFDSQEIRHSLPRLARWRLGGGGQTRSERKTALPRGSMTYE
jgi:hypothetical protein